jgi:hypothetical protein
MIFIDQTSVYKTLLKVNQIGKKMAPHSKYIISNGVLMAYSKQEMGDTEANPVSIGFIDDKLYKKLEGLGDTIGIKINGNDLYKMSQEYDFDSIEYCEDEECIKINFVYYDINNNSYEENFKNILRSKGFNESDIETASMLNYTNNMDMYDLFLQYKKTTEPQKEKTFINIICKFVNCDNFMYKKSNNVVNMLNESELLYNEDIEREILDIIIGNNQPVIRKLLLDNGETIRVRFMKSIFSPIASKNNAGIKIYKNDDKYILVSKIELSGVVLFNVFQILKY